MLEPKKRIPVAFKNYLFHLSRSRTFKPAPAKMSRLRNTAALVQVMTVSCPRLERLHLAGCGWIRPEALEYHAQHHFRQASINHHNQLAPA